MKRSQGSLEVMREAAWFVMYCGFPTLQCLAPMGPCAADSEPDVRLGRTRVICLGLLCLGSGSDRYHVFGLLSARRSEPAH